MTPTNDKLITVLLAVRNGEKTLDRALDSLKKQTVQNFLICCVNDASTDGTASILDTWQQFFGEDRFHILTNVENMGLTRSLNAGLSAVTTPLTARLDADDWWHKTKIEHQVDFIRRHPETGLLGTNYVNITKRTTRPIICLEDDATIRQNILKRNPFAHSCIVFETALVKKLGGYDERVRYGQDYDLWLRMLPHTKMHNLQEFLCFRNAEGGISQEKQNAQMKQCIRTQLKYLKMYRRPFWEYTAILEPLLVILVPECIKKYKRSRS